MVSGDTFTLADILAIANIHPFYACNVKYPPDADTIRMARERASEDTAELDLKSQPALWRSTLYSTINRLMEDTNPENGFRHGVYTSITGGGSGSRPILFLTDVQENRRARVDFGRFLRRMGLLSNSEWVVTTHTSGELYRSLDLTSECFENAGASVLAAGHIMSPAEVVQLMVIYHATVLSGESSQIVAIVYYISTMPPEERTRFKLDKIIYTSEGLTPSQRSHIYEVLGNIKIYSILGSAEAGPYAVSCPRLIGSHWATASYEDFVFDTRMTRIEILPLSFSEYDSFCKPVADGELGIVAQTSLTRLRNPLVRYITGDVGLLHSLPEDTRAVIHEQDWKYLRVLRLQGRDRRFSFEWDSNYLEFSGLKALMNGPQSGVVLWQAILDKMEPSLEGSIELRVLRSNQSSDAMSEKDLIHRIEIFFHVCPPNRHRFKLVFLEDDRMFKRSTTGRKIVQFVNNYN
ncbi:hypothetical protein CC86DRAFT_438506 [Ophiobolus disseminans]|uniref:AMP-dependent synthetase/ligase domain-containing protein n=1 Tax=Ophiobolus disseminans TaxID=1469910 RepID=A0A6A7A589_9PLEO|nr:hypothetical protein CC86DRAFT_438506 [Ophiobolus disseminans]